MAGQQEQQELVRGWGWGRAAYTATKAGAEQRDVIVHRTTGVGADLLGCTEHTTSVVAVRAPSFAHRLDSGQELRRQRLLGGHAQASQQRLRGQKGSTGEHSGQFDWRCWVGLEWTPNA